MTAPRCRLCGASLRRTFLDLGDMPLANAYPAAGSDPDDEPRYPLHVRLCDECLLVQADAVVPPEAIFSDYAYFSSYSESWVQHAKYFADREIDRLGLTEASLVIELASNDGYLLQHFRDRGVPVLGVEPAANVAQVAVDAGIQTVVQFFGRAVGAQLAGEGLRADLLVANNVFAHVPDLNDFTAGIRAVLKPEGLFSIEFPHLLNLLNNVQFDTIYHEHFSYFSLLSAEAALGRHGLRVIDVEELPTHGGSLRVRGCRAEASYPRGEAVEIVRRREADMGLNDPEKYAAFAGRVELAKRSLRDFLANARRDGRTVVAYGAAAKGNTLLNACGVSSSDIAYVVDRNPYKQGRLLPGSRIGIRDPNEVWTTKPDYLLILPWNLADEIRAQMAEIRTWGGQFVVPIPVTRVLP